MDIMATKNVCPLRMIFSAENGSPRGIGAQSASGPENPKNEDSNSNTAKMGTVSIPMRILVTATTRFNAKSCCRALLGICGALSEVGGCEKDKGVSLSDR